MACKLSLEYRKVGKMVCFKEVSNPLFVVGIQMLEPWTTNSTTPIN